MTTSTTDTWEKLAKPTVRAAQITAETALAEITIGTEKQIKYANDLRNNFVKTISPREHDAPVRWAVVKQEKGQALTSQDAALLANDAWDRRTIAIVNTNDAKTIIDWFVDVKAQINKNDSVNRYASIIRNPTKWTYANGGWKQIR